jgi:shikimate kinase
MTQLVVVTGPIASGKSVVSCALADRLNTEGLSVAIADLDDSVAKIDASLRLSELIWEQARVQHREFVGQLLSSGVDVVIAHGPFYCANETTALMRKVPAGTVVRRAMLLATYEVALERVAGDSKRGLSKDPIFLQSAYQRFLGLLPDIELCDWTVDTTMNSVGEIVGTISEALVQERQSN